MNNFKEIIETVFSDFFYHNGFIFYEHIVQDAGNKSTFVYRSHQCKLAFYRSQRDGEVNCLAGRLDAKNSELNGDKWFYIKSLLPRKTEPTIEELLSQVPDKPLSDEEQLLNIESALSDKFATIQKNLLGKPS